MAEVMIPLDKFRTGRAYTISQAARLADVSTQTANRWLLGYDTPTGRVEPLFGDRLRPGSEAGSLVLLSFLDLIEFVIAAKFRKLNSRLTLTRIRDAHQFARDRWGLPYPFASIKLLQLGGHLLREFDQTHPGTPSIYMALDMDGQPTLPGFVQVELKHNIIFLDEFAGRWYPRGRNVPIVVDPHVAAGRPTIEKTGVTLATISRRWFEGHETIPALARDYGLSAKVLEQVLHLADLAA